MSLDLEKALKDLEAAIKKLEEFIPKDDQELGKVFSKAWYYTAFGMYGLELYYKEIINH